MAALDFNGIASALNQVYESDIASQINRASVALQVLPIKPGSGKNVAWDVRLGATQGAAIVDGATVSTFNVDTKVPATLQFATYYDAFGVTGRAMSIAANSGGPEALVDLFQESVMESGERLATILNQDLYGGSGGSAPETIAGLTSQAIVASGSYAGISTATYSQWAGNVLANGGVKRDLSLQLMRDARKAIYLASGKKPDLILCDPNQHERYGNLLGANRRYSDEVRLPGRAPIKLDGGYQVLEFDGIPVIEDKDATPNSMIFLNTREVFIRVLPDAVSALVDGTAGQAGIAGSDEEQYGAGPARVMGRIQPLAVNGDVRNFAIYAYLQLQVRRPNSCGVLGDLNT